MTMFTRAMLIANGTITPVFAQGRALSGSERSINKPLARAVADPLALARRRMDVLTKTDKALNILRKAGAL